MITKQTIEKNRLIRLHRLLVSSTKQVDSLLFCLQPSTNYSGQTPKVYAVFSKDKGIFVSFFIEKTQTTQAFGCPIQQTQRADFLWEENCLELFFGDTKTQNYIEINVTPDGRYNIYQFDDYRTPDQLPPPKNQDHAFTWLASCDDPLFYHKGFYITTDNPIPNPLQINPTAIIHPADCPEQVIFYAAKHTSPADFHDRSVWQIYQK